MSRRVYFAENKNKTRVYSLFAVLLILALMACVDRINIDTGIPAFFPVVIDGFISDEQGPYTIEITKAFDIESKQSIKTPISVSKVVMSDNLGTQEVLKPVSIGVYQTSPTGIRGIIGRTYSLRIELLDGRIYESNPDTLLASGKVDRVYHYFITGKTPDGATTYGFDVFFDALAGERANYHFLWKFVGTFKADTNPELHDEPCGESRCPRPPPCSGYVYGAEGLTMTGPCTCCSCWYDIFNSDIILGDDEFVEGGKFKGIKATNIPLSSWTFMYKVHAEVRQFSLTSQSFNFWKAIKAQKRATNSLFQPLTGKVPSNFTQISGAAAPIEGLFYATSITSNAVYITREDVPDPRMIPSVELPFKDNCINLYPNSTASRPSFWVE